MSRKLFVLRGKFTIFFVGTLLLSTLYPLFLVSQTSIIFLHFLITLVLVAGIHLISQQKPLLFWGAALGILSIIFTWSSFFFRNALISVLWSLSLFIFYIFITFNLLKLVAMSKKMTLDTILGAVSGYFILAIAWGMLFFALETIHPGSFRFPADSLPTPDLFIYYAQITISSVGFGDITPITPIARSLSAFLGIAGQLYLAVLVAILIGVYLIQSISNDS